MENRSQSEQFTNICFGQNTVLPKKKVRQFTNPYFAGKAWIVDAGFYFSVLCCFRHFINSLYWQQKQASIACCQSKQYLHRNRREELDASSILRQTAKKKMRQSAYWSRDFSENKMVEIGQEKRWLMKVFCVFMSTSGCRQQNFQHVFTSFNKLR